MSAREEEPGPPERPARYRRTTSGLLASLVVTVLVVAAFVVFRAAFRDQPEIERDAVDYLGTVSDAQAGDIDLVYPTELPQGWSATSVDFVPGAPPAWGIGLLTDNGRFVGLRQEDADVDDLVSAYVDPDADPGDEVTLESGLATGPWQTWSDSGGDLAYSTTLEQDGHEGTRGETLLVYGSAGRDEQEQLIALLSTDPLD